MPELPEVQCYVDSLNALYADKRLAGIHFYRDDVRYPLDKAALNSVFAPGARMRVFRRVGKVIALETSAGRAWVSLGMSGSFTPSSLHAPKLHEHVALAFVSGEVVGFVDPRRFGFWKTDVTPAVLNAVDPLDRSALLCLFRDERYIRAARPVKALLVDQAAIGGLGNIYALEALFRAGVRPDRMCRSLSPEAWVRLAAALPALLKKAIRTGGSSVATYRRLHGAEGNFQFLHRVYDREGEPCLNQACAGKIVRIVQAGRSSWFCPACQR